MFVYRLFHEDFSPILRTRGKTNQYCCQIPVAEHIIIMFTEPVSKYHHMTKVRLKYGDVINHGQVVRVGALVT